tara:strand:+ start:300 stop:464 length:165 start_codon:yes stop_codon:yes gene_type:complete
MKVGDLVRFKKDRVFDVEGKIAIVTSVIDEYFVILHWNDGIECIGDVRQLEIIK